MKFIKHFFYQNNKLNKGYQQHTDGSLDNDKLYNKRFDDILPPIEVIAQYEELHPGTLKSLTDLIHKEQEHRHRLDLSKQIDKKAKIKKNQNIFLFLGIIFALTSIILTMLSHNVAIAFLSFCIVLIFYCIIYKTRKNTQDHQKSYKYHNKFAKNNINYKKKSHIK